MSIGPTQMGLLWFCQLERDELEPNTRCPTQNLRRNADSLEKMLPYSREWASLMQKENPYWR